jgi:hypothetical protein
MSPAVLGKNVGWMLTMLCSFKRASEVALDGFARQRRHSWRGWRFCYRRILENARSKMNSRNYKRGCLIRANTLYERTMLIEELFTRGLMTMGTIACRRCKAVEFSMPRPYPNWRPLRAEHDGSLSLDRRRMEL